METIDGFIMERNLGEDCLVKKRIRLGILKAVLKIGVMAMIVLFIWPSFKELIDQLWRGSGTFDAFYPFVSLLAMLVGLNLGAAFALRIFSVLRLPGWLKMLLATAITLVSSYYLKVFVIWFYQQLFAVLGALIGSAIIVMMLLAGMCGLGYLITSLYVIFAPMEVIFVEKYSGDEVSRGELVKRLCDGENITIERRD